MARSTYVYVVDRHHVVRGTFTVKHEMMKAVQNAIDNHELDLRGLRIHRYTDGKIAEPVNITEQFHWDTSP